MSALLLLALWLQAPQQVDKATQAFRTGYAARQRGDLVTAHAEFATVIRLMPRIAAGHTAFGAVLLAQGDLPSAIAELETAHRLDANDAIATASLAVAYGRQAKYSEALILFRSLPPGAVLTVEQSVSFAAALSLSGNLNEAITLLRHAVETNPDVALLRDALGSALAQGRQYDAARLEFAKAIVLQSDLASAHLHLGSLDLLEHEAAAAVGELTSAAKLAPTNVEALLQLGRAQMLASVDESAVETLRHAHDLAPGSAEVQYALALALQNTGSVKESLILFAAAAKQRPDDAQILTNYALELVQSGDAERALPLYRRALRLDPKNAVLYEDLGVAYLQRGDIDTALEQFKIGLTFSNDDPGLSAVLHYDLGLALKLKDKLNDAIAELLQAERLDTMLPDPPYTLGVLYMQTGEFDKSAVQLTKATTLRSDNGEAWAVLGSVYGQMNDSARAVPALRRAIELLPDQPGSHIVLGGILARQGDKEEAHAEREKGAELSRIALGRQHADFALRSGSALLQGGNLEKAIAQLRSAVAADPGYASPHRVLADALAKEGNAAEAAIERSKADALEGTAQPRLR